MPTPVLLERERHWLCPNCTATAVTRSVEEQKFHYCPGLIGLWCPMVEEGVDCKVEAVAREDYVGHEDVQIAPDGRPWMAVRVERADGSNDLVVFAPCAHGKVER